MTAEMENSTSPTGAMSDRRARYHANAGIAIESGTPSKWMADGTTQQGNEKGTSALGDDDLGGPPRHDISSSGTTSHPAEKTAN